MDAQNVKALALCLGARAFDLYACNLCRRLCPLRLGH